MFVYKLQGWRRVNRDVMGGCTFNILLDINFAYKILKVKADDANIRKFNRGLQLALNDSDTRITCFEGSFLIKTLQVGGNCCCLGVDGRNQDPSTWGKYLEYGGHNIDTRSQAFDLLYIFTTWAETAEALIEEI